MSSDLEILGKAIMDKSLKRFWRVRLITPTGLIDLMDPTWIVATFGGDSESEIKRQTEDAKETVMISQGGPPSKDMEARKLELDVELVEFDVMGVARL